jgi:hypothetical protein
MSKSAVSDTTATVFPGRMTLDLRGFNSESKEKNGFFKVQIRMKDIMNDRHLLYSLDVARRFYFEALYLELWASST